MTAGPSVLVMLGTDHHRFDRLVEWADAWADAHPAQTVTIQHGLSKSPAVADGISFLTPSELRARSELADVVITHAGPGTIGDARSTGHRPLVLPRDPALAEIADDHQLRFAPWAAERGLVTACRSLEELTLAVADSLSDGTGTRAAAARDDPSADTSDRLARLLQNAGPTAVPDAPLVLYIGGAGRSGSTLTERLLGEMPGVVPLGEVVHLWQRGVVADELCACGRSFGTCEFWSAVGDRAFGGWANVDTDRLFGLKNAVDRQRRIPWTTLRHTSRPRREQLLEYAGYYRAIYQTVRELTGSRVIVDSSKHASLALVLSHDRHIDLRVMHLTRDSRGVAHSLSKHVVRPEAGRGDAYMPRLSPLQSTLTWISHNVTIEGLRHRGVPVSRVQYERLAVHPAAEIARLWRDLSLPGPADLPLIDHNTIELSTTHSVAGNPMRFRSGTTALRRDDQWQTDLASSDRRTVTALSLPALYWLGYQAWPRQRVAQQRTPVTDNAAYAPPVSVVIATRDRPEMLREAIEAVRVQDYSGTIETIVVYDQQEPDRDLERAGERPVRVIANDHKPGLAGARNSGIGAASGEVIAFCDDDDYWLPGKLAAQIPRLADPAVDLVSCGIRVRYNGVDHDRVLDADQVTFRDLLRDRHTELHPSTFVVRRAALDTRIGLVDENVPGGFGEDYEFLLRAARSAAIANVVGVHAVVRWGAQSYFFQRWQTMREGLSWLLVQYPEFEDVPSGSARIRSQVAFAHACLGDRRAALTAARGAFRRNPLEPRTYLAAAVGLGLVRPETVMSGLHRFGRGI